MRIESKKNDTGGFTIKVENNAKSAVVYVEFPHYLADLFTAPDGWETRSTLLSNIGVEKKPGICTASANSPADGIVSGASAEFDMRLGRDGQEEASAKPQTARVRFADGATIEVPGVTLPASPARWSNIPLIAGFAVVVVLFIALGRRKRARQPKSSVHEAGASIN